MKKKKNEQQWTIKIGEKKKIKIGVNTLKKKYTA